MNSFVIPIVPADRYSQERLLADGSVAGSGAETRSLLERIPDDEPVTELLHPEVRYEVTDHCNATCIMCPRDKHVDGREHGIMDQGRYERSIDEVVLLGDFLLAYQSVARAFSLEPRLGTIARGVAALGSAMAGLERVRSWLRGATGRQARGGPSSSATLTAPGCAHSRPMKRRREIGRAHV